MRTQRTETDGELAPNYVIRWKSKLTGFTGGGETRFFKCAAVRIADDLDNNCPNLDHWAQLT